MRWVLIGVGVLAGIIALVAITGAFLPRDHLAARSMRYRESPDVIWAAITNYQDFPKWRSGMQKVEPLPSKDGKPAWRETDAHGQVLPLEVIEWNPPHKLVTRIADPNLPFGGTWTYELEPTDGGTTLRITERGVVDNPIFRFMARFAFGYTATMEEYLRSLGRKFGETSSATTFSKTL
jgi:uncharacterized protein YndB with AHSA1/START domain